jgi:hypothetical protein
MLALGAYFYYSYPHMVKTNSNLFDHFDEDPIITHLDKKWALNTKEISSWSLASKLLMATSGTTWISWLLNRSLDGEGGQYHYAYLRFAQLSSYVTPTLYLAMFARLYNAYNRTLA